MILTAKRHWGWIPANIYYAKRAGAPRMAKGILHKNLNLIKHYGFIRTFGIYLRTLAWHLYGIAFGRRRRYKKLTVNGYPMYVDLRDKGISKALFVYGSREKDQMYL